MEKDVKISDLIADHLKTSAKTKCDIKVKYLATPVKGESDRKNYRVLQLPNRLTVLLVSDLKHIGNRRNVDEKNNKDISGGCVNRQLEFEEKMAACSLCINVGSFNDPPNIQGLAHLLEHAICLGSKKYPEENEYNKFIAVRGGFIQAQTSCEKTQFLFQIHPNFLLPAMDRFAHCFVDPLLKKDVILRERESVDNEFHMDISSDYERLKQFFRIIAGDNHPASKFSCGNLISLRNEVDDDTLCSELREFRKIYYSANRMTLAVQANLSLDTLEQYVKSCFSDIPCTNYLPAHDLSVFSGINLFNHGFRKIYKIKSIANISEMELKWVIPPLGGLNKKCIDVLDFISRIINHEGKGSLSHYLREKKLCNRVSSNNERYSIYSVLRLNLVLSSKANATEDILGAVFSFIDMLKHDSSLKRIFDEIKEIAHNKFRFADDLDSAINVQRLCSNMHLYSPTDYITGNDLYSEFDPEFTQTFWNHLTLDNVFIVLMNRSFNDEEFDKIEPWYRIKYSCDEIPDDWITSWKKVFHLPYPNQFVTTDFRLIHLPDSVIDYPMKIKDDGKLEVWYRPDPKFRLPICYAYLHLITAGLTARCIQTCVMLRLFEILLHELALEDLYDAKCAGLVYNTSGTDKGILVKASGFNEKVPLLLRIIITRITEFSELITEELFSLVKTELLKYYSSVLYDPEILASEINYKILDINFWMSSEKYAVLRNVTFNRFIDFASKLTDEFYVQCLVQGNVTQDGAMKMIYESLEPLKLLSTLPSSKQLNFNGYQIPLGKKFYRVQNLNPLDGNSVVMNYYQTDDEFGKLSLPIFKEFLQMLMQEPLFHQLRTIEQLAYSISCCGSPRGFNITIFSPVTKFTPEYINDRIENFIKHFLIKLKKMSECEFNAKKEYFINLQKMSDIRLKEEIDRNWFAIRTNNKSFFADERKTQISAVSNLTSHEFCQWLEDHVIGGKSFGKLSIQVVGNINCDNVNDNSM